MSYDPTKLVFIDTETTGLDLTYHEVWEIGLIDWSIGLGRWEEHLWRIWPTDLPAADPGSLRVNRFYEREAELENFPGSWDGAHNICTQITRRTANKVIVGANPAFDAAYIEKLLLTNRFAPAWDYHMIDITSLAIGAIARSHEFSEVDFELPIPYSSGFIAKAMHLERSPERHTALGDAREVLETWLQVMGEPKGEPE